ncbi:MAG: saccharopine dehydrogenase NADP-binding domain-containing protein [Pseudomonadota bacterium]
MKSSSEVDVVIFGATGFTGQLIVEYMSTRFTAGSDLSWAMAGRSPDKLAAVREKRGAPEDIPLIVADAADTESLRAMAERASCVISAVGPYTHYGSELVAACAATGTDYVDLSGEVLWMHATIDRYSEAARSSGARIVHSCGFDSIPFDLAVQQLQEEAVERFGAPCPRVRGRMRKMVGTFSGGTAASGAATMAQVKENPALIEVLRDPFALVRGFKGPEQPPGNKVLQEDGYWLAPFIMAPINTKNIHRSNQLSGFSYGEDFVYDEMVIAGHGDKGKAIAEKIADAFGMSTGGDKPPAPGEGPSREERDAGHYEYVAIGTGPGGETLKVVVTGDKDPGYGSTSKIIAEAAACLVKDCAGLPGGIYTPAAAMGATLRSRLIAHAGLTFDIEE